MDLGNQKPNVTKRYRRDEDAQIIGSKRSRYEQLQEVMDEKDEDEEESGNEHIAS